MESEKPSVTVGIAWILLLLLGVLLTLGGLQSLYVAYWGFGDAPAGVQLSELAKVNPELPAALRARRGTAASLAVTCGILLAWIAVTAFKKRERWAWSALLCAFGAGAVLALARISAVGTTAGSAGPGIVLAVILVALAISYRDFRR